MIGNFPPAALVVRLPVSNVGPDGLDIAAIIRDLEAAGWPVRVVAAVGILLEAPVARVSVEWTPPSTAGRRDAS